MQFSVLGLNLLEPYGPGQAASTSWSPTDLARPPQPPGALQTWPGRLNILEPYGPGQAASTSCSPTDLARPPQPPGALRTWPGRLNLLESYGPGQARTGIALTKRIGIFSGSATICWLVHTVYFLLHKNAANFLTEAVLCSQEARRSMYNCRLFVGVF